MAATIDSASARNSLVVINIRARDIFFVLVGTILTIICAGSLLLATNDLKQQIPFPLPLPVYLIPVIAISAIMISIFQLFRVFRLLHQKRLEKYTAQSKVIEMSDSAVDDDDAAENVFYLSTRHSSRDLIKAVSSGLWSKKPDDANIDSFHKHIVECASACKMSASRLLVLVLLKRLEFRTGRLIVAIASGLIWLGRVRLDFLHANETPYHYYRDMWFEDIDLMPNVRTRTQFAIMRVVDAVGIICDYGILSGITRQISGIKRVINRACRQTRNLRHTKYKRKF